MECIRCGSETTNTFFCPCDLVHPLCGLCETRTYDRDCVLLVDWNGYVAKTTLQEFLPGIIKGFKERLKL